MEGKLRGGRAVQEEIFLNYVLFHRVNEEEIAPLPYIFPQGRSERELRE